MPWGHNLVLLTKLKERDARPAYAARALEHGWSRAVLVHHIAASTVERTGKALTNFTARLPKSTSDLARVSLKDPYRLDFLGIGEEADEREIEGALVAHITRFCSSSALVSRSSVVKCTSRSEVKASTSTCSSTT